MRIEGYDESKKSNWDEFVQRSKNGTFLFFRDYMDYHRDRFVDHSLLIRDGKGRLVALLPANNTDNILVSHGGLTYGGFITDERMKTSLMLEMFEQTVTHLKREGFAKLIYKTIPHMYHRLPAEEDSYALFRFGAVLYRRDVTTIVMPRLRSNLQERRSRAIKKARARGVAWGPSEDYEGFWPVLEHNLESAHGRKPVHTLGEIRRLQACFPENIKLFCAFVNTAIVAGTVIYESHKVAHAQYTASSDLGRSCGALDLLLFHLLTESYADKEYFDFGVSSESDGQYLNSGLVEFKEGFGGRSVTQDFYELALAK